MILGCEGLADYHCGRHSLDVPVSGGATRQRRSATKTKNAFSRRLDSELEEALRSSDWKGSVRTSSPTDEKTPAGDLPAGDISAKESVSAEGIALYIDLNCSPVKNLGDVTCNGPRTQSWISRQEGNSTLPSCAREGKGQEEEVLRMTNSEGVVTQGSESVMSVSIGDHSSPMTLIEADNVQKLKRSRQVAPIDQIEQASLSHEGDKTHGRGCPNAAAALSEFLQHADEMLRTRRCYPQPAVCNSGSEAAAVPAHVSPPMPGEDGIQIFKRRRVDTTPYIGEKLLTRKPADEPSVDSYNEKFALQGSECEPKLNGTVSPIILAEDLGISEVESTNRGLKDSQYQAGESLDKEIKINTESLDIRLEQATPPRHDGGGREPVSKNLATPPRQYLGTPLQGHGCKKEWLGHHHGTTVGLRRGLGRGRGASIAADASFAGSVGDCFREAIDGRPVAEFPGVVGDGSTGAQLCHVCGGREDGTASLICDGCERVFHMTCVNSRMKVIPQADDWYCRQCRRLRKDKGGELMAVGDTAGTMFPPPKSWWTEDSAVGRVERELVRMSNGQRMRVRVGPEYQANVPDFTGLRDAHPIDVQHSLAESPEEFGHEIALTDEEKQYERELSEYNVKHEIWPKGWVPAASLPAETKQNWIQCTLAIYEIGDLFPDGRRAQATITCGKWRRAPPHVVPDEFWECSCALVWDPRHADCVSPQELPTEEIFRRMQVTTASKPDHGNERYPGLIQGHDEVRQKVLEAMMDDTAKEQAATHQEPVTIAATVTFGASPADVTQQQGMDIVLQNGVVALDAVKQLDYKPEKKNHRALKRDARRQGANSQALHL